MHTFCQEKHSISIIIVLCDISSCCRHEENDNSGTLIGCDRSFQVEQLLELKLETECLIDYQESNNIILIVLITTYNIPSHCLVNINNE